VIAAERDFMIGALVNEWGETVSLHAGAPQAAFGYALMPGAFLKMPTGLPSMPFCMNMP